MERRPRASLGELGRKDFVLKAGREALKMSRNLVERDFFFFNFYVKVYFGGAGGRARTVVAAVHRFCRPSLRY